MDFKRELERVLNNNGLAVLPANPWEFKVSLEQRGKLALVRLSEVVEIIVKNSGENWPSDDEWRQEFPNWLRERIPELSKDQTDQLLAETPESQWDLLPWEFFSWIDALYERGWQWWGYKIEGNEATIVVHIASLPERIDAFREILKASGMKILNEAYPNLRG